MRKACEDALALTDREAPDPPSFTRITVHQKLPSTVGMLAHTFAELERWRLIEYTLQGAQVTRVTSLNDYGDRMYSRDQFVKTAQMALGVTPAQVEEHLTSHTLIHGARMVPGDYRLVVWGPNGPTLNLWRGYTVRPVPFGRESGLPYCAELALWVHTAFTRTCSGNAKLFHRLISWLAFLFQRPTEKPGIAILQVSVTQGAGKNTLISPIDAILGKHSRIEHTAENVVGNANAFLAQLRFCAIDEAVALGIDAEVQMARLNSLITEREQTIRRLYQDTWVDTLYTMFWFNSNSLDAGLNLSGGSRRFQFLPLVEQRLPESIGQAIRCPANAPMFYGQLLHLLNTIRTTDSLQHVINTQTTNEVTRDAYIKVNKFLPVFYEMATSPDDIIVNRPLGLFTYSNSMKVNVDQSLSKEDQTRMILEKRREFRSDGERCGWFAMPRASLMAKIAAACGRERDGGQDQLSRLFTTIRDMLIASSDEELRELGMNPDFRAAMRTASANKCIVPVTAAGWRLVVEKYTNRTWESIRSLYCEDSRVAERAQLPELGDAHYDAIRNFAATEDDDMWLDVAEMVRHVEMHRVYQRGVFEQHFVTGQPLLLPTDELEPRPHDPEVMVGRVRALIDLANPEDIHRVLVDELLEFVRVLSATRPDLSVERLILLAMHRALPYTFGVEELLALSNDNLQEEFYCNIIDQFTDDHANTGDGCSAWLAYAAARADERREKRQPQPTVRECRRVCVELTKGYSMLEGLAAEMNSGVHQQRRVDNFAEFLRHRIKLPDTVDAACAEMLLFGDDFNSFWTLWRRHTVQPRSRVLEELAPYNHQQTMVQLYDLLHYFVESKQYLSNDYLNWLQEQRIRDDLEWLPLLRLWRDVPQSSSPDGL